jgi:hypothetical protein
MGVTPAISAGIDKRRAISFNHLNGIDGPDLVFIQRQLFHQYLIKWARSYLGKPDLAPHHVYDALKKHWKMILQYAMTYFDTDVNAEIYRKNVFHFMAAEGKIEPELQVRMLFMYSRPLLDHELVSVLEVTAGTDDFCMKHNAANSAVKLVCNTLEPGEDVLYPTLASGAKRRYIALDSLSANTMNMVRHTEMTIGTGYDVWYHSDCAMFSHCHVAEKGDSRHVQVGGEVVAMSEIVVSHFTDMMAMLRRLRNGGKYGDLHIASYRFGPQPRSNVVKALFEVAKHVALKETALILARIYAFGAVAASRLSLDVDSLEALEKCNNDWEVWTWMCGNSESLIKWRKEDVYIMDAAFSRANTWYSFSGVMECAVYGDATDERIVQAQRVKVFGGVVGKVEKRLGVKLT